ncbi:MAG: M23 family metallopeptidase [Oscillospiraceae bacterium]
MKKYQFYIAAGLYLGVTVLKLTIPAFAAELKETILPAMREEVDYIEVVSNLGSKLTENEMVATVMRQFSDSEEKEETVQETAAQTETAETGEETGEAFSFPPQLGITDPVVLAERAAEIKAGWEQKSAEAEETAASEIEETPAVVASFLASQEAYASLDLPENVSYAMPVLPYDYVSPVFGVTSSGFGYRMHPLEEEVRFHYGTDFAVDTGSPICAFTGGTVYAVGEQPDGYGLYVMLDHGHGWITLYAHCSEVLVTEGQTVTTGEQIALVGQTGATTGAHLHFELLSNGVYLNPEFYLATL